MTFLLKIGRSTVRSRPWPPFFPTKDRPPGHHHWSGGFPCAQMCTNVSSCPSKVGKIFEKPPSASFPQSHRDSLTTHQPHQQKVREMVAWHVRWRPPVAVREIYIRAPWGGRVGYSASARGDRALNTLPGLADEESRVFLTHEARVQRPTHPGDKCVVGGKISSHI